jgi:hypothetical protein
MFRVKSRRPWLMKPVLNTVYSIGIYRGPSPLELTPAVREPVFTREGVVDRFCTFVADPPREVVVWAADHAREAVRSLAPRVATAPSPRRTLS